MTTPGSVALVGAGPGDPGLITVRGLALLRGADVVVYDRLVSRALLGAARADAELVSAGREPGKPVPQDDINSVLVARAREGKVVVRLKGGDPFVFGRGGEEAEALARAGVPFEIVPGVSSAFAGPAAAGIPVTHRDAAASVAVVTARAAAGKDRPAHDWRALASIDTVVVLMAVGALDEVARAMRDAGRDAATPAAVVQEATLPTQRTVVGTLGTIARDAARAGIRAPAVLVVGDVVSLRSALGGWDARPLSGVRVLVTRARPQASELSQILRELGAHVVEAPAIRIEPPASHAALDRAVARARDGGYAWLVFTSANGVAAWWERVVAAGADARAFAGARVAAVGPGTADALAGIGIAADLVPPSFTTAAIGKAFPRGRGRVLLARADRVEPGLDEAIERKGWDVERVVAYRLRGERTMPKDVRRAVIGGEIDVITFASGGTVRAFTAALRGAVPARTKVVCIGPVTARAAREAGMRVARVAKQHTIPGLAAAVLDVATRRARR